MILLTELLFLNQFVLLVFWNCPYGTNKVIWISISMTARLIHTSSPMCSVEFKNTRCYLFGYAVGNNKENTTNTPKPQKHDILFTNLLYFWFVHNYPQVVCRIWMRFTDAEWAKHGKRLKRYAYFCKAVILLSMFPRRIYSMEEKQKRKRRAP